MHATALPLAILLTLATALPSQPEVTPPPKPSHHYLAARQLSEITITMVNSMKADVSTSMASNEGVPALITGGAAGTIAAGASGSIVAPLSWNGQLAVGLAQHTAFHMPSLMEAGLSMNGETAMMDIDVSYVNGYTVSITCVCNDDDHAYLAGCSEDLWSGTCGADGEEDQKAEFGVCVNPTNNGTRTATSATPFFKPCENKAYTYPADDKSNSYGKCKGGAATCCVGTEADGCAKAP